MDIKFVARKFEDEINHYNRLSFKANDKESVDTYIRCEMAIKKLAEELGLKVICRYEDSEYEYYCDVMIPVSMLESEM